VPEVSKGIAKLAKANANIATVKSALSKLDKCVDKLAALADACDGPAVMAISMVPNVGSVVGFVCAQAASMVGKFRSVQDRVNSGLAIADTLSNAVSTAEVEPHHVRLTQLALSIKKIGGAVQKVASKVEKVTNNVASNVEKVASNVASKVEKVASNVGKVLASLGNPIDMVLNKPNCPLNPRLSRKNPPFILC
jgi:methyl-accepting chemotaxis protein